MKPAADNSFWQKLVVRLPYAWLIAFFLVPFLIVLKISLSQTAIAQPPYTPTFDLIAGWHGIHEDRGEKNAHDFLDLNVRGTFEVFEAAAARGIDKIIYISTTSVRRPGTLDGRSKILAERIADDYANYSNMNVIRLRPRGFIPHWNRDVYTKYSDWARWFWRGAVHIDDVASAVMLAIGLGSLVDDLGAEILVRTGTLVLLLVPTKLVTNASYGWLRSSRTAKETTFRERSCPRTFERNTGGNSGNATRQSSFDLQARPSTRRRGSSMSGPLR